MKIAFIVFNNLTLLDFIGVYDPLLRLKTGKYIPELYWDICAYSGGIKDNHGMPIIPSRVGEPLHGYDMIFIPGGLGTRDLMENSGFFYWLKTAKTCPLKTSVCTGSLLLGKARFLIGKKATTHPAALKLLEPFCEQVVEERIVDEGSVITAGAVAASLDLGLHLCEKIAGEKARIEIQKQMNYNC